MCVFSVKLSKTKKSEPESERSLKEGGMRRRGRTKKTRTKIYCPHLSFFGCTSPSCVHSKKNKKRPLLFLTVKQMEEKGDTRQNIMMSIDSRRRDLWTWHDDNCKYIMRTTVKTATLPMTQWLSRRTFVPLTNWDSRIVYTVKTTDWQLMTLYEMVSMMETYQAWGHFSWLASTCE